MSTDQPARPSADFTAPETFEVTDWKRLAGGTFLMLGCMGLLLAFFVWFLAGALAGMLGWPMPMLWGVLAAVVVVGILFALKALQVKRQSAHLAIIMSPEGVAQREVEATRFIAWPDLTGAGKVKPLGRMGKVHAGTDASKALGEAAGTAAMEAGRAVGANIGLVGFGRVDFEPSASQGRRALYADGAFGRTPDGRPLMGITPTIVSDAWFEGRMGDWVRHHRPDVLAQIEQQTRELYGDRPIPGSTRGPGAPGQPGQPGPGAPPAPSSGPPVPPNAG